RQRVHVALVVDVAPLAGVDPAQVGNVLHQQAEHVIERTIFHHQHDDVLDARVPASVVRSRRTQMAEGAERRDGGSPRHHRQPLASSRRLRHARSFDSSLAPSELSTFFAAGSPHGHPARISVIDMTIEMSQVDHASDPAQLIEAYYEAGWTDGLPV